MEQFEVKGSRKFEFSILHNGDVLVGVAYPKNWRWLPELTVTPDAVYNVEPVKSKNADTIYLNRQIAFNVIRNWKGARTITPVNNPLNFFTIKLSGFLSNYFELLDYQENSQATVKRIFNWRKFRLQYRLLEDARLAKTESGRLALGLLVHYYRDMLVQSNQL